MCCNESAQELIILWLALMAFMGAAYSLVNCPESSFVHLWSLLAGLSLAVAIFVVLLVLKSNVLQAAR